MEFVFFASDLALCLWVHVSQSWRITSEKEVKSFWLPLIGFFFLLLSILKVFAARFEYLGYLVSPMLD